MEKQVKNRMSQVASEHAFVKNELLVEQQHIVFVSRSLIV